MELKLEERVKICVRHINPFDENCRGCRIDEDNYHCPDYLSQKDAIRLYRPEYTFQLTKGL
jgi:hypothetical protein